MLQKTEELPYVMKLDENMLFPRESKRVNTMKFEYLPARQEKTESCKTTSGEAKLLPNLKG